MNRGTRLLVDPKQAAEMLGISRASLYRLLKANQIKSNLLPGTRCRRIPVEELRNLIQATQLE